MLPVVVLTRSDEERDMVAGYAQGANSYVRKPVDFKQFSDAARRIGECWLMINEPVRVAGAHGPSVATVLLVDSNADDELLTSSNAFRRHLANEIAVARDSATARPAVRSSTADAGARATCAEARKARRR
jgi:CheY-like chemotaxis protein